MKNGLEGIVELSDKWVKLEDIENPRLQRILHLRLRKNNFNFFHSEGYKEVNHQRKNHVDKHKDNHTEYHNENYNDDFKHTEYCKTGYFHQDTPYFETTHSEKMNKGYSESISRGYSEHTDHY
jgi:hypothetical protein